MAESSRPRERPLEPDPDSAGGGKARSHRLVIIEPHPVPDAAFSFPMRIRLNGEEKEIPDGVSVEQLLDHLDVKPGRVAVEINEEIVRKATYGAVIVKDGDSVEVVQFMGGGAA